MTGLSAMMEEGAVVIEMDDYAGFEKVGSLGVRPPDVTVSLSLE